MMKKVICLLTIMLLVFGPVAHYAQAGCVAVVGGFSCTPDAVGFIDAGGLTPAGPGTITATDPAFGFVDQRGFYEYDLSAVGAATIISADLTFTTGSLTPPTGGENFAQYAPGAGPLSITVADFGAGAGSTPVTQPGANPAVSVTIPTVASNVGFEFKGGGVGFAAGGSYTIPAGGTGPGGGAEPVLFLATGAPPPVLSVTPTGGASSAAPVVIDMGRVLVDGSGGQLSTQNFEVENTGAAGSEMSGTFGTPSNGAAFNFVGAAGFGQGGGSTPPDTLDPAQTSDRDYRFDPLVTGSFTGVGPGGAFSILGRDANDPDATSGTIVGEEFYRLEGVGVAPEYSDNVSGNLTVNVRTGDTADVGAFTVTNTGNGNTADASTDSGIFNLNGTADGTTGTFADITGAAVGFSLTDGSSVAFASTVYDVVAGSVRTMGTPETLTLVDTTNGATSTNAALATALTVDVNVVGPDGSFELNATSEADHSDAILADGSTVTAGDTLTFPETAVGSTRAIRIDVSNLSSDGDLGALTDLSYNAVLGGDFEFGFGDTGGSGDFVVDVGELGEFFDVTFSPTAIADFNGTLSFFSDEGTTLGNTQLLFTVNLFGTGTAVPEPASLLLWSLLGLVAAGLVTLRRRRK